MLGARQAGRKSAKIVNTFLKAECVLAEEYRTSGSNIHKRNLGDSFSQTSPLKGDWEQNRRD